MNTHQYFTNDDLTSVLQTWAQEHPTLASLHSLGTSHEGRPIWLLSLTNQHTGSDRDKPALWIDANLHATELAGTTAAIHLAETLLTGYTRGDPDCRRLLDSCTFYLAPRLNPDGAAAAMSAQPRFLRSGVRPYPFEDKQDGLHEEDVDGDGRILQMRIPDPYGNWKISTLDPRLMEIRAPHETDGSFYRLLPEGRIENFDGDLIPAARPQAGLDFNRNFPFEWRGESQQHGAGPFPASEPEVRAVVEFTASHPNINVALTFHTFSRVLLRPYSTRPDDDIPVNDLWVYKKLGEIGTGFSQYRCVSTFHDFKYHPKEITTGAFDDWAYDQFGMYAFTIELWDLPTEAGIKDRKFIEWWREHPHSDDLQILQWAEANAPGGYVDWYPFDHPQLGRVEIGGWDRLYTWRNPPKNLLHDEAARHTPFVMALANMLPHLQIRTIQCQSLGAGQFNLRLVVENSGFFPSYTSEQGKKQKAIRPARVEIELPEGASWISGKAKTEIGYLDGRANDLSVTAYGASNPTTHRARLEWVIHAPQGGELRLRIISDRAGNLTHTIALEA